MYIWVYMCVYVLVEKSKKEGMSERKRQPRWEMHDFIHPTNPPAKK